MILKGERGVGCLVNVKFGEKLEGMGKYGFEERMGKWGLGKRMEGMGKWGLGEKKG